MKYSIMEKILDKVEKTPEEIAVNGSQQLSYKELWQQSLAIKNKLKQLEMLPEDRIVLFLNDSSQMIPNMIGTLLARGTFCSILPSLPEARIKSMSSQIKPKFILTNSIWKTLAQHCFLGAKVICLDENEERIDAMQETDLVDIAEDHPSYIYFTSGSTGVPKGILGQYKSIGHFIAWEKDYLKIDQPIHTSHLSSPMFDASLRDIFLALCTGGTVHIPNKNVMSDLIKLKEWLSTKPLHVIHTVPSFFRTLFDTPVLNSHLQHIFLSGERIKPKDLTMWKENTVEHVQLTNLYGPTETTMTKFYYNIPRGEELSVIPIGQPMSYCRAHLLNEEGKEVGANLEGQIHIETEFRTLGYLNFSLKESGFIPHTNSEDSLDDYLYPTGDIGKKDENGNFLFLGRQDRQMKVRGIRIEAGEIENIAMENEYVSDAVTFMENDALSLFLAISETKHFESVKASILLSLPDYMRPSHFYHGTEVPRLLSGKVDLNKLITDLQKDSKEEFVGPRNDMESLILSIFQDVLNNKQAGIQHDFFRIGGHSLLAMQFLSRLRMELELEVPMTFFFENPTVLSIADQVDQFKTEVTNLDVEEEDDFDSFDLSDMNDEDLDKLLESLTEG